MAHFICIVFSHDEASANSVLKNTYRNCSYKLVKIITSGQIPPIAESFITEKGLLFEKEMLYWIGLDYSAELLSNAFFHLLSTTWQKASAKKLQGFLYDCHI